MRPRGMPPTPRARSRSRLPVGIAPTGAGLWSRVVATPGPRWRSISASTRSRLGDGCGGASRTVAVVIVGGQLLPVVARIDGPAASEGVGTAEPVAGARALELLGGAGHPDPGVA